MRQREYAFRVRCGERCEVIRVSASGKDGARVLVRALACGLFGVSEGVEVEDMSRSERKAHRDLQRNDAEGGA